MMLQAVYETQGCPRIFRPKNKTYSCVRALWCVSLGHIQWRMTNDASVSFASIFPPVPWEDNIEGSWGEHVPFYNRKRISTYLSIERGSRYIEYQHGNVLILQFLPISKKEKRRNHSVWCIGPISCESLSSQTWIAFYLFLLVLVFPGRTLSSVGCGYFTLHAEMNLGYTDSHSVVVANLKSVIAASHHVNSHSKTKIPESA